MFPPTRHSPYAAIRHQFHALYAGYHRRFTRFFDDAADADAVSLALRFYAMLYADATTLYEFSLFTRRFFCRLALRHAAIIPPLRFRAGYFAAILRCHLPTCFFFFSYTPAILLIDYYYWLSLAAIDMPAYYCHNEGCCQQWAQ